MVYVTSKIALGIAIGALLAFSHIQAAPARDVITDDEIDGIDRNYYDKLFEPTKDYNLCKARCYTKHLKEELTPLKLKNFSEDVATLDSCVDKQLANIKTYGDFKKKYEDKKEVWHWNMAQYCADVVTGKGKVPGWYFYKVAAIQSNALSCSLKHCDKPYNDATSQATYEAFKEAEEALKD
ncbi:hypothetical protein BGZ70_005780 [Mortierella alpina]|uniref:Uncharacterized protein n=1 Tax=Mortierella alpina TaxID=64518 RepID=A0A9P6J908_MORAP|nr:hypothetical protein BGZ70_005780 [Mortierella alpina]